MELFSYRVVAELQMGSIKIELLRNLEPLMVPRSNKVPHVIDPISN